MSVVLVMLTIDSLAVISPGGVNVPLYTVINQHIDYKFDASAAQRAATQGVMSSVGLAEKSRSELLGGRGNGHRHLCHSPGERLRDICMH